MAALYKWSFHAANVELNMYWLLSAGGCYVQVELGTGLTVYYMAKIGLYCRCCIICKSDLEVLVIYNCEKKSILNSFFVEYTLIITVIFGLCLLPK